MTDDYSPWRAGTDVLATETDDAPARRAPWVLVGGAGSVVLALVAGVTYAVGALAPGGSQPAEALPSGAFAAVTLDLDPSVGQKLDGFRFLWKFPALRAEVPLDGDVRSVMFEAVAEEAGWDGVDYATEVEPWLGQRIGVAVYPAPATGDGAAEPSVVVALQVTDRDAAARGLDRLATAALRGTGDLPRPGWAFSGDYALLAESQAVADRAARDAEESSLAGDAHFAPDVAAADDGILTAWVDMGAAGRALGADSLFLGSATGVLGSAAGASGRATGSSTVGWSSHPVTGLAELPASSVAAFGLADGQTLVPRAFDSMRTSFGANGEDLDLLVDGLARDYGIRLPEDLALLAGDNLVAALDGEQSGEVQIGARVTTDVAAARGVLAKVEAALRDQGADFPVVRRDEGSDTDLVLASTERQAARLAASGTLGDMAAFQRALPDLADADVAVWVDPVPVVDAVFGSDGGVDENLEPIDGVGVTVSSGTGERSTTYRYRLVAH